MNQFYQQLETNKMNNKKKKRRRYDDDDDDDMKVENDARGDRDGIEPTHECVVTGIQFYF